MQTQTAINWKAILFWGIIIPFIAATVWYFYKDPILSFIQNPTFDLSLFQNLTLDNILAFITKYAPLFSLVATGFTFVYAIYQKIQKNTAETKLLEAQTQAETDVSKAYTVANQYQQDAETYKEKYENLLNSSNQDALTEAQNLVSTYSTENKNLKAQIEALNQIILLKDTKVIEKTVVK